MVNIETAGISINKQEKMKLINLKTRILKQNTFYINLHIIKDPMELMVLRWSMVGPYETP